MVSLGKPKGAGGIRKAIPCKELTKEEGNPHTWRWRFFQRKNTTAWGCLAFLLQNSYLKGEGFPSPSYFLFFPPRYTNGEPPVIWRLFVGMSWEIARKDGFSFLSFATNLENRLSRQAPTEAKRPTESWKETGGL